MMSTEGRIDVADPHRRLRQAAVLMLVAALFPLCAFVYDSSFTRYMVDDYCLAVDLHTRGFLASQVFWYQTWSGRFTWNFVMNAVALLGPGIVSVLPAVALAAWGLAITWAIGRWWFATRLPKSLLVHFALAATALYVTLASTPNVVQSLYWQTNMLSVITPLLLLTIYAGMLGSWIGGPAPGRFSFLRLVAAGGLPFVIAGCTEAAAALVVGVLGLATAVLAVSRRTSARASMVKIFAIGFAGSLLALGLMWFSPGTHRRLAIENPPMLRTHTDAFELVKLTTYSGLSALAHSLRHGALNWPFVLVNSAILGFLAASAQSRRWAERSETNISRVGVGAAFAGLPVVAFVIFFLCVSPAVYVFRFVIDRYLVIPAYFLACAVIAWWFLAGYVRGRALQGSDATARNYRVLLIAAVLAALCGPIVTTAKILTYIPSDRAYLEAWEAQDRALRRAVTNGNKEAVIVPLPTSYTDRAGLHVLRADPRYWINQCVAQYYGLSAVRVRLSPRPSSR